MFLLVVVQGTVQQTTDEEVTCVFNVSLEPGMGEVVQHMLWTGGLQRDLHPAFQNTLLCHQVRPLLSAAASFCVKSYNWTLFYFLKSLILLLIRPFSYSSTVLLESVTCLDKLNFDSLFSMFHLPSVTVNQPWELDCSRYV